MKDAKDTTIVWFRRDMRVDDNPALAHAVAKSRHVVPLFVWAPEEEGQFQPGRNSRWWCRQSVQDLQSQISGLGSRLILRKGKERHKVLLDFVAEIHADAVFFNNLYDPISLVSDHEIKGALQSRGIQCHCFNADLLYEPHEVVDEQGQPFTTLDDFWNKVLGLPYPPPLPVPAPESLPPVPTSYASETIDSVSWFMNKEQGDSSDQLRFKWKPGTPGAVAKLEAFMSGKLHLFDSERAKVDRESTSQLSPWINVGSISIRYIFYRVKEFEIRCAAAGIDKAQSCNDFLRQLGAREYARYLSFNFPFLHERPLLPHLIACPWRLDQDAFKAWRQGQTGYPLVDAAMKQLWSTGWTHNRLRIISASFLVKNLLVPWQWGLKHFWDCQLDANLENDALGWQYVSGGMADAHPFSFLIDLDSECMRLDPDGEFVRRWLPALALLPEQYIHAPWTAPPQVLEAAEVELGVTYPKPIISIHESILNLQHAIRVLDSSASHKQTSSTMPYPYRLASEPLKPAVALQSYRSNTEAAEGTLTGGMDQGTVTAGTVAGQAGSEEHFEYDVSCSRGLAAELEPLDAQAGPSARRAPSVSHCQKALVSTSGQEMSTKLLMKGHPSSSIKPDDRSTDGGSSLGQQMRCLISSCADDPSNLSNRGPLHAAGAVFCSASAIQASGASTDGNHDSSRSREQQCRSSSGLHNYNDLSASVSDSRGQDPALKISALIGRHVLTEEQCTAANVFHQQRTADAAVVAATTGFDYPRYRERQGRDCRRYIDVRLVPEEDVKEAAAAAAHGRLHGRCSIPGLRDAAIRAASLARMIRDSDSAWCMPYAAGHGGERNPDHHLLHLQAGRQDVDYDDEEEEDDECVSEEVVSNTVGLGLPQASGFSGFKVVSGRHEGDRRMNREEEEEEEEGVVVQGAKCGAKETITNICNGSENVDHPNRKRGRQHEDTDSLQALGNNE
ncbi:hypothetical protein CEUSTIGMA_g10114.t1 [Chlamydomonas eustigma]|uniref:Photolyase/cryptochrome alpha/beta domain-containing protein n=1 Tax=Chlamydomonas eustigma TaxID=1157962 RepID=A0A250XHY5_9CHLO|nr:hypothetical protein CEUSTIGMA_g10114.t1 [Chlamydomonas eustigma]|eukprot:GAX82688.1 hypothetical protein CEUSTIGMA_g10114.t1 [Chlamydomonas eustigma]